MSGVRILIAAGGSGGHIFPAIALARGLKSIEPGAELLFIGNARPLDRRIFEREGVRYSLLSDNKLPYGLTFRAIPFLIKLAFDIVKSLFIVAAYRPQAAVTFGGYVSGPAMLACYMCRVPSIAHEQNVIPGRANRLFFRLADRIAVSFEETRGLLSADTGKVMVSGNPIRPDMSRRERSDAIAIFGFREDKFTILVIGGSQGAHFLNETFVKAVSNCDKGIISALQVIHITGIKDYDWVEGEYDRLGISHRAFSFIDRIDDAYSASDLAVTRAGSSAIFELASFGVPMILIPYPYARGHQIANAEIFSDRGAAIKIEEKDLSADRLKVTISGLINDRARLKGLSDGARRMSNAAASETLAKEVLKLAG